MYHIPDCFSIWRQSTKTDSWSALLGIMDSVIVLLLQFEDDLNVCVCSPACLSVRPSFFVRYWHRFSVFCFRWNSIKNVAILFDCIVFEVSFQTWKCYWNFLEIANNHGHTHTYIHIIQKYYKILQCYQFRSTSMYFYWSTFPRKLRYFQFGKWGSGWVGLQRYSGNGSKDSYFLWDILICIS